MLYKAEYEDGEFEIFSYCSDDDEAIFEAQAQEQEHGTLWSVHEVDDNYDEVRTVW